MVQHSSQRWKYAKICLSLSDANKFHKILRNNPLLGWSISIFPPRPPRLMSIKLPPLSPEQIHSSFRGRPENTTAQSKSKNHPPVKPTRSKHQRGSSPSTSPLKIGSWNVCGWGLDPAHKLRGNLIKALDLDIICICETFLTNSYGINLDGYTWFGNNRRHISKRAVRGSGG